jgi:septal ring factor EnvC (AmiA/AmiB activator)
MRYRRSLPTLFVFVLALSGPALAASPSQDKLQKVESEMALQKKQAADLDRKTREANDNLQDLRHRLIEATRALEAKEDEQQEVEDRLHGLENEIATKNEALAKSREELATLTDVLIRLGQQPPETWFLHAGLTDEHIHRAILARSLIPRLEAESESTARDLAVLADLRWMAGEQKRLVEASRQNLKAQQSELDQLVQSRQGLLSRSESQKAAISKKLVALSSQARDLRQLLARVSPPTSRPKGGTFHAVLERPVGGTIIRTFGSRDADGITSHGITFKTMPGSPVVAPAEGRVVFAGPFRGYGNILILQHAGGYHSFLAGFGRIDADMGQEVTAGEPLGLMPAKGSVGDRPELYFEWRRNGEPVDPMQQKFKNGK